jgi:hypothetical protein
MNYISLKSINNGAKVEITYLNGEKKIIVVK